MNIDDVIHVAQAAKRTVTKQTKLNQKQVYAGQDQDGVSKNENAPPPL